MTPGEQHRLDMWRKDAASRRPAPSAALLERLRLLITPALPRAQAAPALTGAAPAASPETDAQHNPGGNTQCQPMLTAPHRNPRESRS